MKGGGGTAGARNIQVVPAVSGAVGSTEGFSGDVKLPLLLYTLALYE